MGQAGKTIHVVHDLDGNRLAEYEIDNLTGAQTLLQEYIWFDGVPVAVVDGQTDEVFFVRTDHIGRPVFATDDTGVKVWEASYLPFGGVHVSTGNTIDLRFPGQWFHASSGLHQNWMREYDPTTGRYMQADPLGLVDGASVYGYALQNPGRYVDPRGENIIVQGAKKGVEKALKWCKDNLRLQGPDEKLFKYGRGRLFQLLVKRGGKKRPFFRLDYDEHILGTGKELHCHCGFGETYVPLDPRPKSWRSPR